MMRGYEITKNGAFSSSPRSQIPTELWGYREQDLQRQISLTKTQLRDLRMSNESNQAKLLDHSQRQGTASSIFFFYLSSSPSSFFFLSTNRQSLFLILYPYTRY